MSLASWVSLLLRNTEGRSSAIPLIRWLWSSCRGQVHLLRFHMEHILHSAWPRSLVMETSNKKENICPNCALENISVHWLCLSLELDLMSPRWNVEPKRKEISIFLTEARCGSQMDLMLTSLSYMQKLILNSKTKESPLLSSKKDSKVSQLHKNLISSVWEVHTLANSFSKTYKSLKKMFWVP